MTEVAHRSTFAYADPAKADGDVAFGCETSDASPCALGHAETARAAALWMQEAIRRRNEARLKAATEKFVASQELLVNTVRKALTDREQLFDKKTLEAAVRQAYELGLSQRGSNVPRGAAESPAATPIVLKLEPGAIVVNVPEREIHVDAPAVTIEPAPVVVMPAPAPDFDVLRDDKGKITGVRSLEDGA